MWRNNAHTRNTLTKVCSTKVKFECTDVEHKYFMDMKKKIVGRDVLLSYPNFSEEFKIHTDASK